jgi:hypothetical protein
MAERGQRWKPTADDIRFVSERIGWFPLAALSGWQSRVFMKPDLRIPSKDYSRVKSFITHSQFAAKLDCGTLVFTAPSGRDGAPRRPTPRAAAQRFTGGNFSHGARPVTGRSA